MFGTAYTVDILRDGAQLGDQLFTDRDTASDAYKGACAAVLEEGHDVETTVRYIRNGDILAEATYKSGELLAFLARELRSSASREAKSSGLMVVDAFIAAYNPHGHRRAAAVWTPDRPSMGRRQTAP